METRKKIKPATPGLIVRDPATRRALPAKGKTVTMNSYWRRRLADGSAVEAGKATAKSASKTTTKQEGADK